MTTPDSTTVVLDALLPVDSHVPVGPRHGYRPTPMRMLAGRAGRGAASEGEPPARATYAVGELLGMPVATLPGDHGGFGVEVEAFVGRLNEVITEG